MGRKTAVKPPRKLSATSDAPMARAMRISRSKPEHLAQQGAAHEEAGEASVYSVGVGENVGSIGWMPLQRRSSGG